MTTVGLVSLGCSKNRVDAEKILGGLARKGFRIVADPERAEVVIVNTCGFIRDAVEENVEEILAAARWKEEGRCRVLVVAGCLPKRYPEMADELPEVDYFFTPEQISDIGDELAHLSASPPALAPSRYLTESAHSAYLKIAEGCSNRCSYCTIPSIRGDFRAFPEEQLLAEAEELASLGAVELNLVAQDVTSYGSEPGGEERLVALLRKLEGIDPVRWIRLLYGYPGRAPAGLVEHLQAGNKVVPYLDMPIQHAHPEILKAMGRRTSAGEMDRFFGELKEGIGGLVLRTTVIVGFPGETPAHFQALLDFVEKTRFNHLGAFIYSPEEGTPAAALAGGVDEEEKVRRFDTLMELQSEISSELNSGFVGRELDVLIDGVDEDGRVVGRTYGQAPEVDGCTLLEHYPVEGEGVEVGAFLKARITASTEYDLVAEPTGE